MATVIHGGNRELDLFISGEPHPTTMQFMRNQAAALGDYAKATGSRFAASAVQVFNDFYSDNALRHARLALSKVKTYFQGEKITELFELSEFQLAPPIMQRYIMSQPDFRKMYHDGRCNGYSGSYIDMFPGCIGDSDYNYRRVMDGMLQPLAPTEDNPDGGWKIAIYSEDLLPNDRHLDIVEQTQIISTWERQRYLMKYLLDDLSSPLGDSY